MSIVDSHPKQKQIASVIRRAALSSSLSSLSSSSSSLVCGSTSSAISPCSMTPRGGSRIMYDRQFLLDCRNSPLARSPLQNLPNIPGVTCDLDATHAGKSASKKQNKRGRNGSRKKRTSPEDVVEEHQFQLDL